MLRSICIVSVLLLGSSAVEAQSQLLVAGLHVGSGAEMGPGQASSTTLRQTPIFAEGQLLTGTSEQPELVWGGGIRVEVQGKTSVAIVPRAAWSKNFGWLKIRPSIALPFFFAPFSMLGAELATSAIFPLSSVLSLVGSIAIDVFFWGSDVPGNSTVVMANFQAGVEMTL